MIYFKLAFTLSVLGAIGAAFLYVASEVDSDHMAVLGIMLVGAAFLGLIGTLIAWVWSL